MICPSLSYPRAPRGLLALTSALLLGLMTGCALVPMFKSETSFSYAEIDARLNKRFPVERNIADFITIKLMRPRVNAVNADGSAITSSTRNVTNGQQAPLRLAVTLDLDVKLPLTTKSLWGAMTLSGVPYYDAATRAVLLRDAKLDRVRVDNMPDALTAGMARSASGLAKDYLEDKPIYTFREEDLQKWGTTLSPTRIDVAADRLIFILK